VIIAGLDLGKRVDHSALLLLDDWTVTHSMLVTAPTWRAQADGLAPVLDRVDLLAFDGTGVGDAVAELLPPGVPRMQVVWTSGRGARREEGERWLVGKPFMIDAAQQAIRTGRLAVAPDAIGRDELRDEMVRFVGRGEASTGHDDRVASLLLAVFGRVAGNGVSL
jgi:hypothetical protein